MNIKYIPYSIILLLASCTLNHQDATPLHVKAQIYPDFSEVTMPCNIAPPTFALCDSLNNLSDLQAVFKLILFTAMKYHVPQKDLPSTLYIVTDMEFDSCARGASLTNFEKAKALYRKSGFIEYGRLPHGMLFDDGSYHDEIMMYKML